MWPALIWVLFKTTVLIEIIQIMPTEHNDIIIIKAKIYHRVFSSFYYDFFLWDLRFLFVLPVVVPDRFVFTIPGRFGIFLRWSDVDIVASPGCCCCSCFDTAADVAGLCCFDMLLLLLSLLTAAVVDIVSSPSSLSFELRRRGGWLKNQLSSSDFFFCPFRWWSL